MTETPQQAARRLPAKAAKDGYKLEALHEYRDADGSILYWRIRLKHPDGRKWIKPMRLNGDRYELKEPEFTNVKPLYRLPELLTHPDEVLWFCEGEGNADRLALLGVLSTTSGSNTSARKAGFSPLANRHVSIWPDTDEGGLKHAQEVAEKLIAVGASVRLVNIKKLNLPHKDDCVDWLEAHPGATTAYLDKLPMADYATATSATVTVDVDAKAPCKSQATRLIELAQTAELFHDAGGKGYAT
ncbi:MAG TPA: hypothetical protein VKB96_14345, partial [Gammaproteobacteria bacterium]|nr:hypothetical protein [Gammaproteobacteria bacterium]